MGEDAGLGGDVEAPAQVVEHVEQAARRLDVVGRGIDALNDSGGKIRVSGEVVFDTYVSFDPVAEFLRSQARIAFIPGNVDRTGRSTGTFAS